MDHVWRLRYGAVDFSFGDVSLGVFHTVLPTVSAFEALIGDQEAPRGDGVIPGEDFLSGQIVQFTLGIADPGDRAGVEALRDLVASAWRADAVRRVPGALATLESPRGRIAYGRPREFTPVDTLLDAGGIEAVADFRTMIPAWFGTEHTVSVPFATAPTTGFTFPVTFPLYMQGEMEGSGLLTIGGDLPTPLEVLVYGPIDNARVDIGALSLRVAGSIAYDDYVIVDALHRTVTRSNGSGATLTPGSTRLGALTLEPGQYAVALRGTSQSGTARVEIRYRDAFASY